MTDETWLREAPLQVLGRLPDSSNNALLCSIASDSGPVRVVYKPQAGERPLWDFPSGTLCRRERAAAVLDAVLGWGLVPATA
ncbi:MAG TPA: phosphatidylinositol kinase, partial [Actinomycetota bacterium]|nr:phosphatidylinositol kinase [Actinomycetota bacterium]